MYENLLLSQPDAHITQVTLNRPRQFNALSGPVFRELHAILSECEQQGVRVLILTGAGRAFCFGADFEEFQDRERLPDLLELYQTLIRRISESPVISIASLNGFATGAGMDLALACDLRIASDRVKMGEAYIGMGLVPDGGGSYWLPRLVGPARALHMLLTGESLDAADALALGLLNQVVAGDDLSPRTLELAKSLAAKPQTALREIKRLVRQNMYADLPTALQNERKAQLRCFEDEEHKSLVHDFLARRRKA